MTTPETTTTPTIEELRDTHIIIGNYKGLFTWSCRPCRSGSNNDRQGAKYEQHARQKAASHYIRRHMNDAVQIAPGIFDMTSDDPDDWHYVEARS